MKNVKQKIADKLITYLQGLGDMDDMNHIVIQAPPGYGKTMLGFHLSEIFYKLGLIKVINNTINALLPNYRRIEHQPPAARRAKAAGRRHFPWFGARW